MLKCFSGLLNSTLLAYMRSPAQFSLAVPCTAPSADVVSVGDWSKNGALSRRCLSIPWEIANKPTTKGIVHANPPEILQCECVSPCVHMFILGLLSLSLIALLSSTSGLFTLHRDAVDVDFISPIIKTVFFLSMLTLTYFCSCCLIWPWVTNAEFPSWQWIITLSLIYQIPIDWYIRVKYHTGRQTDLLIDWLIDWFRCAESHEGSLNCSLTIPDLYCSALSPWRNLTCESFSIWEAPPPQWNHLGPCSPVEVREMYKNVIWASSV